MVSVHYRVIDSPVGLLTLAGNGQSLLHLRMTDQAHEPARLGWQAAGPGAFNRAVDQLEAYFSGQLTEFDLDLRPAGSAFQQRVWSALRTIPYGETRSYGQIATQIGSPGAARAVGLANGRNPIAIIVPCHRVVGANGSLTGYAAGLDRKRALLEIERATTEIETATSELIAQASAGC